MFIQHNLSVEDPRFVEALEAIPAAVEKTASLGLRARWAAEGPGPVALTGGEWVNGVVLAPLYQISLGSQVRALECAWSQEKLGEWLGHTEVRILLMDSETKSGWTIDVTHRQSSVTIVPTNIRLSANCFVVFQMKAGDRVGKLYRPPYIKTARVNLLYQC